MSEGRSRPVKSSNFEYLQFFPKITHRIDNLTHAKNLVRVGIILMIKNDQRVLLLKQ